MENFDRRKFLKGSTVAAGLAGAMTVVPGALPALAKSTSGARIAPRVGSRATSAAQAHDATARSGKDEPVVAHVRDAKKGEIDVFVGTRHFLIRDRSLADRIVGAAS
jgi:hypothetical protein